MESSKKSKKDDVDEISRETQRLIKDSHVSLPYHKPKQKSLKDFLDRQKITPELLASLTGSKELLRKAWDLIEKKEQTVEKFYNEDSVVENASSCDDTQVVNPILPTDNNDDAEASSFIETNNEKISVRGSDEEDELSTSYDDDENSNQSQSTLESSSQPLNVKKRVKTDLELSVLGDLSTDVEDAKPWFLCTDSSDSDEDSSSDEDDRRELIKEEIRDREEDNRFGFIKEEIQNREEDDRLGFIKKEIQDSEEEDDDEDIYKKRKTRMAFLSESSDEDSIGRMDIKVENFVPLTNQPTTNISTQQLMDLCSGQFVTQSSGLKKEAQENYYEEFADDFDSDVPLDETNSNMNNDDPCTSSKYFQNDFEPDFLKNDGNNPTKEDELHALKLTSAKDFFDNEAELSESDWSSDDEDHLAETIDKLEEEIGDKDQLDEDEVRDGLNKIYMRQILDDDNQQVTALKEMLLEDGELHSDSGRKRKFQWDEIDEDNAFKKPLFSDNEDENDDPQSDDEKSVQWRKERFKRESFLSQKNNSDSEEENDQGQSSNNIAQQSLISIVEKTHVVENYGFKITNVFSLEEYVPKINENTANRKKLVKGSFLKHNSNKLTTTLLNTNKKSSTNNDGGQSYEKSEIKSLTTIVSKASSNPFAYLLRNQNPDTAKITSDDSLNIPKKGNLSQTKTSTITRPTEKYHQKSDDKKSTSSILKHLD